MPIARSRTAHPISDGPRGLTMGMWGTVLLLVVMSTFLAGISAAGLYLHTGAPAWPPEPLTRPGSWPAVGAIVLTFVGTALVTLAALRLRRDERPLPSLLLLAAGAALTLATVILSADLASVPFGWQEHAYASVYVVLSAVAAIFTGTGAIMVGSVLIQRLVGVVDAARLLEVDNVVLYLWWTALIGVPALLAIVHLLPDPGGPA
jgi:heme/copper-type cytochrome/quinol oxidase subunit 3